MKTVLFADKRFVAYSYEGVCKEGEEGGRI
jgi:hypothetical protein